MVALLIFSLPSLIDTVFGLWHLDDLIDTVFGLWHLDDLIVDPRNFEWMREANSPVVSQLFILL